MSDIKWLGVDLAKNVFFLVGLCENGKVRLKRKLSRKQFAAFLANSPACELVLEACGGSHYWARKAKALGHHPVLLPAQRVKAYRSGQKNDYNDAQACAEAGRFGAIRPVTPKTPEQQAQQSFQVLRASLIKERTRMINQMRGLLGEFGVVIRRSVAAFERNIHEVLEDAENELPDSLRELLNRQLRRYTDLCQEIAWYDAKLRRQSAQDEVCRLLMSLPGFGPVVSVTFRHWIGDGYHLARARDASAAVGLVPRQRSTGGKQRLGVITKVGDAYLRSLLVHGARSFARQASKKAKDDPLAAWVDRLIKRRGHNRAVVALANKLVRIAWAVVRTGQPYQPRPMQPSESA